MVIKVLNKIREFVFLRNYENDFVVGGLVFFVIVVLFS